MSVEKVKRSREKEERSVWTRKRSVRKGENSLDTEKDHWGREKDQDQLKRIKVSESLGMTKYH